MSRPTRIWGAWWAGERWATRLRQLSCSSSLTASTRIRRRPGAWRLRRGSMSSKKDQRKEETQNFELRLHVIQYLILAIFVALGIRFYFLQVSQHENYVLRAENNRIREIPILASRGLILDRNKIVLVDNTPAYNIVVMPEDITDRAETVRALVENLGVDRDEVVAHLNDPMRPKSLPILLKQNASNADRAWVAAHELEHPEIQVEQQPQRLYKFGKT